MVVHQPNRSFLSQLRCAQRAVQQAHHLVQRQLRRFFSRSSRVSVMNSCASATRLIWWCQPIQDCLSYSAIFQVALGVLQELLDPMPRARYAGQDFHESRLLAIAHVVLDLRLLLQRLPDQQPARRTGLALPHGPDPDRGELKAQRPLGSLSHPENAPRFRRQRRSHLDHRGHGRAIGAGGGPGYGVPARRSPGPPSTP
jgi:hypothetical protein